MKSLFILLLLAVLLFNIGYAAPPINPHNNQHPLLYKANLQALKATKLNVLDFILDTLSTVSDNLKNHKDATKGLTPLNLFYTMFGKLISGVKKDADPNDILQQSFLDFMNTMLSFMAKDFDNGEMQNENNY